MNLKEQLKYDKLQLIKSRLYPEQVKTTIQTTTETTKTAVEGPKTIEIAGKKILAMPLESMRLTPEQEKKFIEAGGLMNPKHEVARAEENKDKMMYWVENFENEEEEIDGERYKGFDLFKKVYEAFPHIQSMSKEQATALDLYPDIHYRNYSASKWFAEMNGGRFTTLDKYYSGELRDIYNAAEGKTGIEKLASIGQAPFGWRGAQIGAVFGLGKSAMLASSSFNDDGSIRGLDVDIDGTVYNDDLRLKINAYNIFVVLDK